MLGHGFRPVVAVENARRAGARGNCSERTPEIGQEDVGEALRPLPLVPSPVILFPVSLKPGPKMSQIVF